MFAPDRAGGQVVGQFVTKPFKSWANQSQKMTNHGSLFYHLMACTKMHEFLATYEEPSKAINTQLGSQAQKQHEENRLVIESLFKVTMLLGKQGLAFRGHRDDKIVLLEHSVVESENHIELVYFRAETDTVLAKHLNNAPKNAKYTSKTIQNQMIYMVANKIRSEIINYILSAQFYSIIADELSDISNKEQVSLPFQYVLDGTVKEVFADFVEVERITGK